MNQIELKPVKESTEDYEQIEKRILAAFKSLLYRPIVKELDESTKIQNAKETPLAAALRKGRVSFSRGAFRGKFSAAISKELRSLGAKWDRKTSTYKIGLRDLPMDVRQAVSLGDEAFKGRLEKIDAVLVQNLPAKIAESIKTADLIDSTLWKVSRSVDETLKGITVPPKLSAEDRKRVSDEWQNNMDLWIKDFTEKEIAKLRKTVRDAAFSGQRRESLHREIMASYDVTANKARFLARQETSLLMTKFKEVRYTKAGVNEYRWGCVAGSPLHPVRPAHKALEGKIFRWNDPPITTAPGEPVRHNNPGQDYNCRCFARPIVKF